MTINQIRYFFVAAKCLNFTKAADQLYISQSALSRQISSMEAELNLQLFVRTQRYIKLTPAGKTLLEGLEDINDTYNATVARAKTVQTGVMGQLDVGILDGTRVDDLLPPVIRHFTKHHPGVDIKLRHHSFNGLIEGLYDGSLDMAITLFFDIEQRHNLMFQIIEKTHDHIVVPKNHPLAGRKRGELADLHDETFIIVAYEDSGTSGKLILDAFRRHGFVPQVRYSPSIQTSMLWIQSGVGIGMLDSRNILRDNPNVVFLDVEQVSDPSLSLVWSQDNQNPYRAEFGRLLFENLKTD